MDQVVGFFLAFITPLCISVLYIHWRERWGNPAMFSEPIRTLGAALVWPCILNRVVQQVGRRFITRGGLENITGFEVWGIILIWLVFGGLAMTLIFGIREVDFALTVLVGVTFAWYLLLKILLGGLNRIVAH